MSKRLDKVKLVRGKPWERMDSLDNIGVSTYGLIKDAIKEGQNELAKDLIDYLYFREIKFVLDANIDLVGGFPQFMMTHYGEDELYGDYKDLLVRNRGLTKWPMPPVKKRDISNVEWAFDYAARMLRLHRMGKMDGTAGVNINEYEDRVEILWDPCYTGGRTRRGDPIASMPAHTAHPFNYTTNKLPHFWTGGMTGVTGYCIHCFILHMIMDYEQTGYLGQWIVGYPENPWEPCPYIAYKDTDWIPAKYYEIVGAKKPKVMSKKPAPKNPKLIRTYHSDELGPRFINSVPLLRKTIDAGKKEEALKLVDRMDAERRIHRYPLTWNWGWSDTIVRKHGYNELYHAIRSLYSRYEPPLEAGEHRPTKSELPSAEDRVRKAALWGRGDRSGPDESSVKIVDEGSRYVMELNPCGSVGRGLMSWDSLDPVTAAVAKDLKVTGIERGPYTKSPFNFGVSTERHPVLWNKLGVPHACARSCVHFETSAVAKHGYLTTVIERSEDPEDPNCRWFFYKDLDDVPEKFYTRIGAKKPPLSKK
ncbi:MAG: hypothetical protein V1767_07620 [Chloroflexota bacterium]